MEYSLGRGIADITGEPADCGMMGYGKADQRSAGIHLRLRARAFVVDDGRRRVLLVVAELPLVFDSVRQAVLARLAALFGGRYTDANTMLTCTHTHCGPGGYSHHTLYNATTGGFHHGTFDAIVDGVVEAVRRADDDLAPGELRLAFGELQDASVNRSPTSFALNPPADRAVFPDAIDPQTTLLTVLRKGAAVGAVHWFATHGTSMSNRNRLISGDNKGYAAWSWEHEGHRVDHLAGEPGFVGAFAQTNSGDMSPNLNRRPASGPTEDEVANTRIIGSRQRDSAAALLGTGSPVSGPVDSRLTYIDLSAFEVDARFSGDGHAHRTSGPYAGAGQVAGTDEGKGFAGFRQGRNPLLDAVSARIVYRASAALRDSQAPKALVLPRATKRLTPLVQERVPVQLVRVGPLYLIGLPAEITIVSGLRLRRAVAEVVRAPLSHVLVAGYSNGYVHYVTTPEEYDGQRYEAGSTMYGRWELAALVQTAVRLAEAMRDGADVARGTPPPDLSGRVRPAGEPREDVAVGGAFGDVLRQPRSRHRAGDEVVVEFVGANPNNNLRRGGSYLEVQRRVDEGWLRVADDGHWSTRLRWRRAGTLSRRARAGSVITVQWTVPATAPEGTYRVVYLGDARGDGTLRPVVGESRPFEVVPA